jgi:predicted dehydrogenase
MKASVIGTGFGANVVAKAYGALGIATTVVSARDADAVARACAANVDLVSVHSPPFLHREHVLAALAHGRNALCDKPFGRNPDEAGEMLDAARKAGVLHFLNFEFREDVARGAIKRLIDEGAIGEVRHLRWSMYAAAGRNPEIRHGWLFDKGLGGGWIGAYGSHVVDTLRWWLGEIDGASALRRTDVVARADAAGVLHACTAEDGFAATFRLASGTTASLDTAYCAAVTVPQQVVVYGTAGMLALDGITDLTLTRPGEKAQRFAFPPPLDDIHERPFAAWATRVRDAISGNSQIAPSFEDGLACARVLAMLRA